MRMETGVVTLLQILRQQSWQRMQDIGKESGGEETDGFMEAQALWSKSIEGLQHAYNETDDEYTRELAIIGTGMGIDANSIHGIKIPTMPDMKVEIFKSQIYTALMEKFKDQNITKALGEDILKTTYELLKLYHPPYEVHKVSLDFQDGTPFINLHIQFDPIEPTTDIQIVLA